MKDKKEVPITSDGVLRPNLTNSNIAKVVKARLLEDMRKSMFLADQTFAT